MKRPNSWPSWTKAPLIRLALPLAWLWVWRHERRICHLGRPLQERELIDASAAGVARPEDIRLLLTRPVPVPGGLFLSRVASFTQFPMGSPIGMALGYGIYLDSVEARGRSTFVHECVHVAQYETLGGKWAFLRRYLDECIRESYWSSPMEAEANRIAASVCAAKD